MAVRDEVSCAAAQAHVLLGKGGLQEKLRPSLLLVRARRCGARSESEARPGVQGLMSEEAEAPDGLQDWRAPDGYSVYAAGGSAGSDTPRTLVWQSYLKEGDDGGGCS